MARTPHYNALVLSSDPGTLDELTAIAKAHFERPTIIYWEMGNAATKPTTIATPAARPTGRLYATTARQVRGLVDDPRRALYSPTEHVCA